MKAVLQQPRRRFTRLLLGGAGMALMSACAGRRGAPPELPELTTLRGNAARVQWTASVGPGGHGFAPSLVDGRLWCAASDGQILGLDAGGRSVDRLDTGLRFNSGVGSDGSLLVLTDVKGQLHGIETNGELRWSVNLGAEANSVPAVGSGMAVVRLSNNSVAAYDLADGSVRWLYTRRNPSLVLRQTSLIALDPAAAYVGLPGGRMVALSLTNGASLWEAGISLPRGSNEIERIADVVAQPILSGSSLCAAAFQGRVTCLNRDSGQVVWSQNLQAGSGTDLDGSYIVVSDVDSRLHAFTRDGQKAWSAEQLRGRQLGPPTLFNGRVWVGDANGYVHVLNAGTGESIGRVGTDGSQIFMAPLTLQAGTEQSVIVQTARGTIAAVTV